MLYQSNTTKLFEGKWRRYLYSSPNIVRVIKSKRRWFGHMARMGEERGVYSLGGKTGGKVTTEKTFV